MRLRTHWSMAVVVVVLAAGCDRGGGGGSAGARPASAGGSGAGDGTQQSATRPTMTTGPRSATTRPADAADPRLYGTWVARDVDAKMGEVKIEVTFKEDGPLRLLAWSDLPFVGQVRNRTAPYTVDGDTISSDAIRGGTSVQYSFDGGQLLIRYKEGKTVRFDRKGGGG